MIVKCETCEANYDDAKKWTLCPHPDLHSFDGRGQIQKWKETHILADGFGDPVIFEGKEKLGLHERNINVVDTATVQNKEYRTFIPKNECRLSQEKLIKLCECLGLTELYKSQRIILDIDTEGFVRIYTKDLMMGKQFDDVFNLLLSEEE